MSNIDPLMKKVITDVMTDYNDPSLIRYVTDPASFAHGFNCGAEKAKQEQDQIRNNLLAACKSARTFLVAYGDPASGTVNKCLRILAEAIKEAEGMK